MNLACVYLVICMVLVGAPIGHSAISCGQVTSNLATCLGYLQKGGSVPSTCCAGVRNIAGMARTTPDRQAACNCIKATAIKVHVNERNAQALPGICKVNIPYKISMSTNCAR